MGRVQQALSSHEKLLLGRKCCNCGSTKDIEYHHIVPISLGGRNKASNLCTLCYKCHSLIHFGKDENISHSELTKAGIARAKKNGKQIGQRKGAKLVTKKSIAAKEIILKHSKDFNGTLSDAELLTVMGLSKNTYYKYKGELKTSAHIDDDVFLQ